MATFYSTKAGLYVQLKPSEFQITDKGQKLEKPGKSFQFRPYGKTENKTGQRYGELITEDPEVIAYCQAQIKAGSAEILSPEEYMRRTRDPGEIIDEKQSMIDQLLKRLAAAEAIQSQHGNQGNARR